MAAASTSPAPGPTPPVPPSCKASPHKRAKACKRLFALDADVLEDEILRLSPDLLDLLLQDHAEGTDTAPRNIFWATGDYQARGEGYQWHDPIRPDLITGANGHVIIPRFLKRPDCQTARVHGMAEVFTPAWICNTQNNLLDEAWFGRKNVFNVPVTHPDGSPGWEPTAEKIAFPPGKTWQQYIRDARLEITCGEAPYVASRYDAASGTFLPVRSASGAWFRIGLIDRKLRIVSENTATSETWLEAALDAFRSTYAFEWQGDSLLLARETLFVTLIEYYREIFGSDPKLSSLRAAAGIISWNVWQMDGRKAVLPGSCHPVTRQPAANDLFADDPAFALAETTEPCPGCKAQETGAPGSILRHNGIFCRIREWPAHKKPRVLRFTDALSPNRSAP